MSYIGNDQNQTVELRTTRFRFTATEGQTTFSGNDANGVSLSGVDSSSHVFLNGAKLSPDCDFAMIWYYDHDDRMVKVSLRAFHDHIDVSEIAKKYGGGGHKKAAGFTLPGDAHVDDLFDLPDEITEEEPDLETEVVDEKEETDATELG